MNPTRTPLALPPEFVAGMLAASPDCVKLLSCDGVVLFMNERGVALNELDSVNDVLGQRFADLWPAEEQAKIADAVAQAAAGQVARVQGFCPTAKGTARWWEAGFSAFVLPGTGETLVVGISRDISERVLAEQALRQRNAQLHRLYQDAQSRASQINAQAGATWSATPDLMGVLGADGIFESFNPAWHALLGWSEQDLATTPFFDFLHPDDLQRSAQVFEALLACGEPVIRFENRYRCRDGSYLWVSWVSVLEGGRVYCTGRDITQDKQRSPLLAKKIRERDNAWNLSQDLMAIAEPDGTLRAVNGAWTALLQWSEAELVGQRFAVFTHPEDLDAALAVFAGILQVPLTQPYEFRLRHRDGSWRWFAWTAALEEGAVYANGRETTALHERGEELRNAEEALRQSQKMEAVGQLTGGLAHDFNNLLAGITGSLELVRKRVAEGRLADLDRYVGVGLNAARRAAALTHRLLAFSRRQTLAPKVLAVNRLMLGMEDLVRRTMGPEVELEVVAGVGLWNVQADASQLENALLNLCINARDAMPQGGKLTIETANRRIDERSARSSDIDPGQYVSLCVSDNGVGMAPDVVARAFDPFFTTKPMGLGTGLGLSMIYGFAKQSGGQARIYSEVGEGTMVCVYLPRHLAGEPEDDSLPEPVQPAPAPSGRTVLVLDDEPTVRMVVVEVMQELGYATLEAGDGAEALKLLESPVYVDLLVSDVGLPGGMNGRQVADAARVRRPGLKVLFITGYAENAVLSHGHLDPGMHVITKPFDLDTLARRTRELIDSE